MDSHLLDMVPIWCVFPLCFAVTTIALWFGHRFGQQRAARQIIEGQGPVGALVGAITGLLAFMLAFTFSLAASRFEARRQVLLEETNNIGTAYLRTRLLPAPESTTTAQLLRDYVDVRIQARRANATPSDVQKAISRSEALHGELWKNAVTAAEKSPTPTTCLFIEALNLVIDVHAKRVTIAIRSRVPAVIWLVLTLLTFLAMATIGYQAGSADVKLSPAAYALVVGFSVTYALIIDLDRPSEGLLKISQLGMIELQEQMKKAM